jgi:Glycosyl transferase family 2
MSIYHKYSSNHIYMKTILFTNARDEHSILEWSIHHINLGFTAIYIYDHKSVNPINLILNGLENVIVNRIDSDDIIKINLIKEAVKYSNENNYDWMLYLDADEFLALPLYKNVNHFLDNYKEFDQICINWVLFGSNYLTDRPLDTILESYIRSTGYFDKHIKCFVKPNIVVNVINPHYYIIKDQNNSTGIFYNKQDSDELAHCSINDNIPLEMTHAYIAHYIYQAYNVFTNRKIDRKRDDNNESFGVCHFDEKILHTHYNDIITTNMRDLYNNTNKIAISKFKIKN